MVDVSETRSTSAGDDKSRGELSKRCLASTGLLVCVNDHVKRFVELALQRTPVVRASSTRSPS